MFPISPASCPNKTLPNLMTSENTVKDWCTAPGRLHVCLVDDANASVSKGNAFWNFQLPWQLAHEGYSLPTWRHHTSTCFITGRYFIYCTHKNVSGHVIILLPPPFLKGWLSGITEKQALGSKIRSWLLLLPLLLMPLLVSVLLYSGFCWAIPVPTPKMSYSITTPQPQSRLWVPGHTTQK